MALSPLFFVTQDLDSYFVDKDTGLPLANGLVYFYRDSERTVPKTVYQLTGGPPYNLASYVPLPNPIVLSAVGTVQNAAGDNIAIYYYPYDDEGNLDLYYVVVEDSGGTEQFTREAWPPNAINSSTQPNPISASGAESFLVGWDFTLNPFQFGNSSTATPTPPANGPITSTPGYIADQTIAASSVGTIAWAQDSITNGLNFTTDSNDAFYILQYLSGDTVKKMIGTSLSVNVFGYVIGASLPVNMQIYLFRAPSTATIPTLPATIGTIAINGNFTLTASNWDAIPRGGSAIPNVPLNSILTNSDINNSANNYGFNGWQITDSADIANTDLFAIVVTFAYASASTSITINSISLTAGDIPSRPAIKTPDETLRECQYYYQKSFIGSQVPQQALGMGTGELYGVQTTHSSVAASAGPIIAFQATMRTVPSVTLYNPISANAQIRNISSSNDWSASGGVVASPNGCLTQGTTSSPSNMGDILSVHWSAEARLGLV